MGGKAANEVVNGDDVAKEASLADAIAAYIAHLSAFDKADVWAAVGGTDVEFGIAYHKATEKLRDERGIVFVSATKSLGRGSYVRATEKQKLGRAAAVRAKAFRTRERAVAILDAVDTTKLTRSEQEILERRRERYEAETLRHVQLGQFNRKNPTTSEIPAVPRRGEKG